MYIKKYDNFINEEGSIRNILLSTILSLGISNTDAQTIKQDSLKQEVIKDISRYNKSMILGMNFDNREKLLRDLSLKMEYPDEFLNKYLKIQPDGTLIVKPDFIEGLELYMNIRGRRFGFDYNIKF